MLIKPLLLVFGMACSLLPATTMGAETRILRRVALAEDLDPNVGLRLMQYTSTFSLLPQRNVVGGNYTNNTAPPGTSAGAATAGNIIGMLIVKGITQSEQTRVHEFREKLEGELSQIDIAAELSNEINTVFQQAAFKQLAVEKVMEPANLEQAGLLVRIPEDKIVTLVTSCYFDSAQRSVHLSTAVRVWKKDFAKPIYFTEMRYSSPSLEDGGTADLRSQWTDNNGALLIGYLREGVREVGRMLRLDLLKLGNAGLAPSPVYANWTQPQDGKKVSTAFYLLDDRPERIIGRPYSPEAGLLVSIPRDVALAAQ